MANAEELVEKAIAEGRISPRNRRKWIRNVRANASTAQIMAKLEPVLDPTPSFDPTTWKL
ncbi:hypothetical protein [Williamsia sp. 1135]|uniref:hypothetical protein n=1 Tax=Williamsia sp. 1135 TaxID=1889262 RepID=UPI000A108D8E|nr:hypothetical protein [Williamsia sp. 1135]ORM37959.1 hypothetical protein BFL43_02170 [Williamsia sp. 1135]